jgi:oligopeptide transport system substrate-binding protein
MKGKKLLALLLAGALAATTLLSGCKKEQAANTDALNDADQYVNYVFNSDLQTADPSLNDNTYGGLILTDTLEALTRIVVKEDGSQVIEAAGAEKWDISDDGLTYTFHLRDFTWEDGQKVTAQQYAYSMLRTLDPATASNYAYIFEPIKNAMKYNSGEAKAEDVGIKATDDKTLVITLEQPTPYFMQITYFTVMVPQREDLVTKHGSTYGSEANTILSCGPFKMTEWTHDNKIVLAKNDKYWDKDKVKLNNVTIKIIKEEESRYQELFNGGLDMVNCMKEDWKQKFQTTDNLQLFEITEPTTRYMFFNETYEVNGVKFFSNAKIRKAFSVALDRKELCELAYENTETPATGWVPTNLSIGEQEFRKVAGFDPVTKLVEENKDPKALLIEGLKELGADPDPSKYTINYLVGNTSATGKRVAEIVQQELEKALGVKMEIEQVESAVRSNRVKALQYGLCILAWLGDFNDPATFMNMWRTTSPTYKTGYANTKYDELLDAANKTADMEKRLEAYKAAEKLLIYEDAAIAPISFTIKVDFWNKKIKNVMQPTFGTIAEFKYAYVEKR